MFGKSYQRLLVALGGLAAFFIPSMAFAAEGGADAWAVLGDFNLSVSEAFDSSALPLAVAIYE